jgi:hypothetical protein
MVKAAFSQGKLHITFPVPLTEDAKPFVVFRIQRSPVPLHGNCAKGQNAYTITQNVPDFLAVRSDNERFVELTATEFLKCAIGNDGMCPTLSVSRISLIPTCIFAIYNNNHDDIKSKCTFIAHRNKKITSSVTRISSNFYLLSNVNSPVKIICGDKFTYEDIGEYATIRVPCLCHLETEYFTTQITLKGCSKDIETALVKHPLNYAQLVHLNLTEKIKWPYTADSRKTVPTIDMPSISSIIAKAKMTDSASEKLGYNLEDVIAKIGKIDPSYEEDEIKLDEKTTFWPSMYDIGLLVMPIGSFLLSIATIY